MTRTFQVGDQLWLVCSESNRTHDHGFTHMLVLADRDREEASAPSVIVGDAEYPLPPFHVGVQAIDSELRGASLTWRVELQKCPWGSTSYISTWTDGVWLGRSGSATGNVDVEVLLDYADQCRFDAQILPLRGLLDCGIGLQGDLDDLLLLGGLAELEGTVLPIDNDQSQAYMALADLCDHWNRCGS